MPDGFPRANDPARQTKFPGKATKKNVDACGAVFQKSLLASTQVPYCAEVAWKETGLWLAEFGQKLRRFRSFLTLFASLSFIFSK